MHELHHCGVKFTVTYRRHGGDEGPSIRVLADVPGQSHGGLTQLLRFDCFIKDPHYHYDPDGSNIMFHLDPLTMGDALKFSLESIQQHLGAMIAKAGFETVDVKGSEDDAVELVAALREAVASEQADASRPGTSQ